MTKKKVTKTKKQASTVKSVPEINDLKKLGILIIVIVLILAVIYLCTAKFEHPDDSDIFNNSLQTAKIQYKEIMIGTIFQQGNGDYYVLVIDDKDPFADMLTKAAETYQEQEHKVKLYTVDLNNIFNKSSKAKKSNFEKDNLKFKGNTLLTIKDKEIIETIEDSTKINNKLSELNK